MTPSAEIAAPPLPRPRRWRAVCITLVALGSLLYFGGGYLIGAESQPVSPLVAIMIAFYAPIVCMLLLALWYAIRGPGRFKRRALILLAATLGVVAFVALCDKSSMFVAALWGVPSVVGATVLALALLPRQYAVGAVVACTAVALPWELTRLTGTTGQFGLVFANRWSKTGDELAAEFRSQQSAAATATVSIPTLTPADWPGLRGAARDAVVPAEALAGWSGGQPKPLWHRPVGPAWSSFVGVGDYVFTQEQRDQSEAVVCWRADTGQEVWAHLEEQRHEDFPAGPGPRATPTLAGDKLYTLGATSVLTCLNAADGKQVWRVNLNESVGAEKPVFGYAASPLVVDGLVIVNPSSAKATRLAAYDAVTGEKRWAEGTGAMGYSSPHLAEIAGVKQVLIFDRDGVGAHDPKTGKPLWHYDWLTSEMEPSSVQPLVLPDGRVIVGGGGAGTGTRCIRVKYEGSQWSVEDVWQTKKFTPKFNDSVVVGDHLYGLDGSLCCISLKDGKRVWKGGKYGAGQLLLAAGKLLVVSEAGKLALVDPRPEAWKEVWSMDALTGKSWNHMAVSHGRLLMRNAEEAAAFDLTTK